MAKLLKSQKLKNKALEFVGYQIPEKVGFLYSLGVPILFPGQNEYVCGSCYLLLRSLNLRYSSRSPFRVVPQTSFLAPKLSLVSKDGCQFHFLALPPSLFPNSHQEGESISTACSLVCRKTGVMLKKVNIPYQSAVNEKSDISKNFGAVDSLICSKLTALQDWRLIYRSI